MSLFDLKCCYSPNLFSFVGSAYVTTSITSLAAVTLITGVANATSLDATSLNNINLSSSTVNITNTATLNASGNITLSSSVFHCTTFNTASVSLELSSSSQVVTHNFTTQATSTVEIDATSIVNANGGGYSGQAAGTRNGLGPGAGLNPNNAAACGGAGHGGSGGGISGVSGGVAYDSVTEPTLPGSSGCVSTTHPGGAGGGVVSITSAHLTLNGNISADGLAGVVDSGGGSGGSVLVQLTVFEGTGTISAQGGAGPSAEAAGGAGGGGRVAVHAGTSTFSVHLIAYGGAAGVESGGPGTVYTQVHFAIVNFNLYPLP
jgi:hypothetical protein